MPVMNIVKTIDDQKLEEQEIERITTSNYKGFTCKLLTQDINLETGDVSPILHKKTPPCQLGFMLMVSEQNEKMFKNRIRLQKKLAMRQKN